SMISVYIFTVWSGNEPFLFYSATGLIAAIIIAFFVKEPAKNCKGLKQNSTSYSNILHALKEIRRPAIHTGICLYGGSYGIFITVIPGVLLREKAFSQSEVGLFFALFYIAISISQVFAGKLSDRHGRNVTMVMGLLLVMTGLAPFMFFTGKGILAALFLASFGLGMFCVSSLALLNEAVPDSLKGSISGLFYLLWGIGYFLFPPLMANLGRYLDFHMLFPILSFVVLAELIALAWKPGTIRDSS
nr:MFS transporter [Synergistales bacterium]